MTTPLPASNEPTLPGPGDLVGPIWDGFWSTALSSPWIAAGLALFVVVWAVRIFQAIAYPSSDRDPVRLFTRSDRAALTARAGGRCEHHRLLFGRCRQTERLEADHIHPHSRGGQTALPNGQMLCRTHNRMKRATIPFFWQLRRIERRRAAYFPPGAPAAVVRRASRATMRPPAQTIRPATSRRRRT